MKQPHVLQTQTAEAVSQPISSTSLIRSPDYDMALIHGFDWPIMLIHVIPVNKLWLISA